MYLPIEGLLEDDLHVDNTARITRTRNLIRRAGLDDDAPSSRPREATVEELARIHSLEHVERMEADLGARPRRRRRRLHADGRTLVRARPSSSAGSALTALELVLAGEVHNGPRDAAPVRPPRVARLRLRVLHLQQLRDRGGPAAREQSVPDRVAIVHRRSPRQRDGGHLLGRPERAHGLDSPGPSFPVETGFGRDRGRGEGEGRNVNVNLPAGTGDPGYHYAIDRIVAPVLRQFAPELVLIACGVDASLFDPLSRLGITAAGFAGIAERLLAVADEVCQGRLVSVQEGGYSHVYAPFCWLAVVETIARLPRHEDPYEAFIAGQACCREFPPWQRDAIDGQAASCATRLELSP